MTIYGTPGGTPLNTTPFQGTQPGNAAGAALPGIPPNMSVLAAVSAGLLPINALLTNYGLKHQSVGRTVLDAIVDVDTNGTGPQFVANGGTPNASIMGGAGPGAGQQAQSEGLDAGEACILPVNAPAAINSGGLVPGGVTWSGGTPQQLGTPVNYGG